MSAARRPTLRCSRRQPHLRRRSLLLFRVRLARLSAKPLGVGAMEFQDLLAPVGGEFDAEEALGSWRWLIPDRATPLAVTAFGDLFFTSDDGAVLFLDTISGTCAKVAESVAEWEQKVRDGESLDECFMPSLVQALRDAGHYLSQGECYDALHSIIIGGEWSVENFRAHQLAGPLRRRRRSGRAGEGPAVRNEGHEHKLHKAVIVHSSIRSRTLLLFGDPRMRKR